MDTVSVHRMDAVSNILYPLFGFTEPTKWT